MRTLTRPGLDYVRSLCDDKGMYEHAQHTTIREYEGQCSDDAGRLLALCCDVSDDFHAHELATIALRFLEEAWTSRGFKIRRTLGDWGEVGDDATGRALYGLGIAGARAPWDDVRTRAHALFDRSVHWRSVWPRSMAYATLGASEMSRMLKHEEAISLCADTHRMLTGKGEWYEPRLYYANALLCEADLLSSDILHSPEGVTHALTRLGWLAGEETSGEHFSFTPVGGRDLHSKKPVFDQQPIEAAAMASACYRAYLMTNDLRWCAYAMRAVEWFMGDNDGEAAMVDSLSGGCYDGLGEDYVNLNEGAESALCLVSALEVGRRLNVVT